MLAQKGYLGELFEPQITQIFADARAVCPRFILTPGSSPGQALAFSHRGRGDAIRRPASPAFASPRVPLPCGKGTGGFATRAYRCGPPLSYGHFPRERGKPGHVVGWWVSRA